MVYVPFDRPAPPPPEPPAPAWGRPSLLWVVIYAVAISILITDIAYNHLRPSVPDPAPPAAGVVLGRQFVPQLAAALADGFEALARDVAAGKPVAEADEHLRQVFQASRQAAFAVHAAPAFAQLVPEGGEPKGDEGRAAYAALARDFARGLRGTE